MTTERDVQIARLEQLRADYDHAFLDTEGVAFFTKPFGFMGTVFVAHSTRDNDPKGLLLDEGIDSCEGQSAEVIAEEICNHLGVGYLAFHGRGKKLQHCCEMALNHLRKTD